MGSSGVVARAMEISVLVRDGEHNLAISAIPPSSPSSANRLDGGHFRWRMPLFIYCKKRITPAMLEDNDFVERRRKVLVIYIYNRPSASTYKGAQVSDYFFDPRRPNTHPNLVPCRGHGSA